tara:strand:+ start:1358 stop:3460 length:2103 start_codon:yes stop_codon:yes gene_type:complete
MALTQVSTAGVKDDAVTSGKIPANAVNTSEIAASAVTGANIADNTIPLSKLQHGTSSQNGKFLRANNGADPSFESIPAGVTINNQADNRVITATGTTDTLNGEANLTFDSSSNGGSLSVSGTSEFQLNLKDSNNTGNGAETAIAFRDSGDTVLGLVGYNYWGDGNLDITNNTSGQSICFQTGGDNERMRILSDGKVGIGTSSPAALLTLNQATPELRLVSSNNNFGMGDALGLLSLHTSDGSTPGAGEVFRIKTESSSSIGADYTTRLYNRQGVGGGGTEVSLGNGQGSIYLSTNTAGNPTATVRMVVMPDGKIGMGTTSPAVPLEIKQGLNEKLRLTSTNDNTNYKNEIGFYNASTKKAAIATGNGADGNSVGIQLYVGSAEKARLDKDGNFQIGNTSNTGTYTEDFNGSGTTTYPIGGRLNVHGGIRVTGYSSKGSHSSNGENLTAGIADFMSPSQYTRGGGKGYFTMGWKTTCRSGEVVHTETSNAYKKTNETNSCAYYIEAGASGEAGGIVLDENCVYVYGSSDNGQTFRITDKDSDIVVAEMTQSSWNWNVRGGVNSNQSLATISDKTVKKGFKDVNYTNILTDFAKLQLKSFIRIDQYDYVKKKYKDQEDLREVGLVAQDVESVFPDCIAETKNLDTRSYKAVYEELGLTGDDRFTSLKNLNVNGLIYKTIAAVQELIKENTSLKNRVAALEAA